MKIKELWRKFWHLLWIDQSLKGWIFSFIVLFVLIKLILFPSLNFITGTTYPLAIVESCSMYHEPVVPFYYNFDEWWNDHEEKYETFGINEEEFKSFKIKNGFSKGDILFAVGEQPEDIKIGDIVMFRTGQPNPIIHRVVEIKKENNKYIFSTIGDNNWQQFTLTNNPYGINEISINEDQIVGKAVFRIAPYAGWAKLIFFDWMKAPSERGLCKEN